MPQRGIGVGALSVVGNLVFVMFWPTAVLADDPAPSASDATPRTSVVVRLHVLDRDHLNAVAGELDIWETHLEERYVVAAVSPTEYEWLERQGYLLEIDAEKTAQFASRMTLDPRFHYFDEYNPNPNGLYVVNFLEDISDAFPELTALYDIGNAWMAFYIGEHQRDIWVLRITNEDPTYGPIEEKPAFFMMATIHAREVAVPELAIRYIKYLTTGFDGEGGYGVDADATWLVNHNVAYILVMQNPDGHWKNEQDTWADRRKNMNWTDGCEVSTHWGVDLNRNHSFLWGCCGGSSDNPCATTFRGSAPASEPETQAFQDYFASVMRDQNGPNGDDEIPPAAPDDATGIFLSLHSFSDLVLWPWGFDDYGNPPNYAQLTTIGRKFCFHNGYEPSATIWYDVDGASDDWVYGKFGIPSYTFEVGQSSGPCGYFFPQFGCIDGIDDMPRSFWAENKPAFLYAHKIARTPYMTAYGPDTKDLAMSPMVATYGTPVALTGTVVDQRLGGDVLQPIAAAEYFIDSPGADGTGPPLLASDGDWGATSEGVIGTIETCGLTPGWHYVLAHGQNDNGDWGPFTAVFMEVKSPGDTDADGTVDQDDFGVTALCLTGPDGSGPPTCTSSDADCDGDIDLADIAVIARLFTTP